MAPANPSLDQSLIVPIFAGSTNPVACGDVMNMRFQDRKDRLQDLWLWLCDCIIVHRLVFLSFPRLCCYHFFMNMA